ncbi:hypothetical protein N7468_006761 [Penicillium chermesinum]|uniref:Ankyrin repeat protein n=1 Tax=Penicillium chermesinum TaxID=63820 RepID=A0A9W9NTJ8_9EURO|nr:uncharacterized protein N7468_006761 [Penicillium chermesinum]KAJ5225536.1 hypothetical protein N7468_006761 [Penicillium chermesinum]
MLTVLLKLNLNPNATTSAGLTPLHYLIINHVGSFDSKTDKTLPYISLLLSHGAQIDAPISLRGNETALHLAVTAKIPQEILVSFLIQNGASVNAKTKEGKTPLHLAAERGRHNIFKILLAAGADPHIKAPVNSSSSQSGTSWPIGEGITALDLAQKNPVGVLWFDDQGRFDSPQPEQGRHSVATTIEEVEITSEIDEMAGSTLVGDEAASLWSSRASTRSMENPSLISFWVKGSWSTST